MDAIRITDLVKKYGTVTAVEGLSSRWRRAPCSASSAQCSGKSTTIGCLTGLLDPPPAKSKFSDCP